MLIKLRWSNGARDPRCRLSVIFGMPYHQLVTHVTNAVRQADGTLRTYSLSSQCGQLARTGRRREQLFFVSIGLGTVSNQHPTAGAAASSGSRQTVDPHANDGLHQVARYKKGYNRMRSATCKKSVLQTGGWMFVGWIWLPPSKLYGRGYTGGISGLSTMVHMIPHTP
jgi:hypothetical protein